MRTAIIYLAWALNNFFFWILETGLLDVIFNRSYPKDKDTNASQIYFQTFFEMSQIGLLYGKISASENSNQLFRRVLLVFKLNAFAPIYFSGPFFCVLSCPVFG